MITAAATAAGCCSCLTLIAPFGRGGSIVLEHVVRRFLRIQAVAMVLVVSAGRRTNVIQVVFLLFGASGSNNGQVGRTMTTGSSSARMVVVVGRGRFPDIVVIVITAGCTGSTQCGPSHDSTTTRHFHCRCTTTTTTTLGTSSARRGGSVPRRGTGR
jgi:hypothetical protein